MPRTKGAFDKRPRKGSTGSKPRSKQTRADLREPKLKLTTPAPEGPTSQVNPAFLASIETALSGPIDKPQEQAGAQGATTGTTSPCDPAPASADPLLTKEAWEGVLRVPFRLLAQAAQAPGVTRIGEQRARDLAKPSYVIMEHYAREYMALNPDNPLSLAWAATVLVLCDVGADVVVEISRARAERSRIAPELPGGQVVQQAA